MVNKIKESPLAKYESGFGSAIVSSYFVGALDGFLAVVSSPYHNKLLSSLFFTVLCSSLLCSLAGAFLGVIQGLIFIRAQSLPWLRAVGQWILSGPSVWFKPDPVASSVVTICSVSLSLYAALGFVGSSWAVHRFHRPVFVAIGSLTVSALLFVGLAVLSVLVSGWVARFFGGVGRKITPGIVLGLFFSSVLVVTGVLWHKHHNTFMFVDQKRPVLVVLWIVFDCATWAFFASRGLNRRLVHVMLACCVIALPLSSFVMNRRSAVSGAIISEALLTGYVVRTLHSVFDYDRDGYSAYWGGRDCNDGDPQIHPGVPEIVANSRDENCSGEDASEPRQSYVLDVVLPLLNDERPSFVLVSVDAMRPDHMGLYGYARRTTPNIDRFARAGAWFSEAYCTVPNSIGSLASVWTGRYFSEEATTTLSEQLSIAGYRTAAFCGDNYFSGYNGFYRGFSEVFEGRGIKNDGNAITLRLRHWLRERSREAVPFFSWIHLMEPHVPYVDRTEPIDFGHSLVDQYDEGIARADQILGPLLDDLVAIGSRRKLVVVIFADHGEGLGEHGVYSHASDLHREALRVPLIMTGTGIVAGERRSLASLLDLHPTILSFSGLRQAAPFSGFSLLPSLRSELRGNTARGEVFSEILPSSRYEDSQYALYVPPHKLIYNDLLGVSLLYNISRDPLESVDLSGTDHRVFDQMSRELRRWMDSATITRGVQGRVFSEYGRGISRLRSDL